MSAYSPTRAPLEASYNEIRRPSSRPLSRASSFGSARSGISHPPRTSEWPKITANTGYGELEAGRGYADFTEIGSWLDKSRDAPVEKPRSLILKPPPSYGCDCCPRNSILSRDHELLNKNFCLVCSKEFKSEGELDQHIAWFHGNYDPEYGPNYGPDSYTTDNPLDNYSLLPYETLDPSMSDMGASDPGLIPKYKFRTSLHTPRWVRGVGDKREGWCGFCEPGRWLLLKNSAFCYDKCFNHGINETTGTIFRGPNGFKHMGNSSGMWKARCGSCGEWIALVNSQKKGKAWYRHAYMCHPKQQQPSGESGMDEIVNISNDVKEIERIYNLQ